MKKCPIQYNDQNLDEVSICDEMGCQLWDEITEQCSIKLIAVSLREIAFKNRKLNPKSDGER